MSEILKLLGQHLAANSGAYWTGSLMLLLSAVKCMPKPGSPFKWTTIYTWVYETMQSALPVPRSTPTPTLPVSPAPTK